jgi:hypothetical protein
MHTMLVIDLLETVLWLVSVLHVIQVEVLQLMVISVYLVTNINLLIGGGFGRH